eukprot:SM000004S15123  [mRNA]  locus=s4:1348738:1350664:- [translate_table: standard]
MRAYRCLEPDAAAADAFYVPFYPGLEVERHLFCRGCGKEAVDRVPAALAAWLAARPEWQVPRLLPFACTAEYAAAGERLTRLSGAPWQRHGGQDHFMVFARSAWDFRRDDLNGSSWGNSLLDLPALRQVHGHPPPTFTCIRRLLAHLEPMMTVPATQVMKLHAESGAGFGGDAAPLPYPTFFHPSSVEDLFLWQMTVIDAERDFLSCLVVPMGLQRREASSGDSAAALQVAVRGQCQRSPACRLAQCGGAASGHVNCGSPEGLYNGLRPGWNTRLPSRWAYTAEADTLAAMAWGGLADAYLRAVFSLHPPGDHALQRRSVSEALAAGCIPVLFTADPALRQHSWHLPGEEGLYSVVLPERGVLDGSLDIEAELRAIPAERVKAMREAVWRLIPALVYAEPSERLGEFADAFDVAVEHVLDRVAKWKRPGVAKR